jgi:hypothetical protein
MLVIIAPAPMPGIVIAATTNSEHPTAATARCLGGGVQHQPGTQSTNAIDNIEMFGGPIKNITSLHFNQLSFRGSHFQCDCDYH